jgi:hypothetical protein
MPPAESKEKTLAALENGPALLEGEYNQDVFLCQLGETPYIVVGFEMPKVHVTCQNPLLS